MRAPIFHVVVHLYLLLGRPWVVEEVGYGVRGEDWY